MANRTVYGNSFSENLWPMVDEGSCQWVSIPGTNVTIQVQVGIPVAMLRAFVADINAFVQEVHDDDTACWTSTNSVSTSNHLSATAVDVDWDDHPMGPHAPEDAAAGWSSAQVDTIRQILDFYTYRGIQMIWWGNDWNTPHDSMHFQVGYDTFDHQDICNEFIAKFIRADGFSTFRRGNAPATPPAVVVLANATGINVAKALQILPTLQQGLALSQCTNVNRIAMWLAQMGHESASFVYTEEIQSGDESTDRWKYKGRTWIQITWASNYLGFSQWAFDQGLVSSPTYFVDNPKQLADLRWAGIGPAWYWTVARPQINALSDNRDLVAVTQAINGGQNGAADRKTRYDRALALGDQLLALLGAAEGEDDLSEEDSRKIDVIYQEVTKKFESRSPLRHLDQTQFYPGGLVDTFAGMTLNDDGMEHVQFVIALARYNHPDSMALLNEIASGDPVTHPDRAQDIQLAQAILHQLAAESVKSVSGVASSTPVPSVVVAPAVSQAAITQITAAVSAAAKPSSANNTTGQLIGQAFDALEALKGAQGALSPAAQASVDALIGVLRTETETTK